MDQRGRCSIDNAWLHVSMDSDIGNNKKSTAMWVRIVEVFKENMGARCNPLRNNNSLQLHWGKIQAAVNKFVGHYERLDRHPKSGTNLDDLIKKAMGSYEDIQGSPFKYLHCWEIMSKNPKWYSEHVKPTSTNKKTVHTSSSPVREDHAPSIDEQIMASGGTNSDGLIRPQGRKACKERKRMLHEEKGVVDALNKLQGTLEKQVNANIIALEMRKENDQKELQLKQQLIKEEVELKKNVERRKEREHIMTQDLSKLSPTVRAAYEVMQANILKEWKKDGFLGSKST
ncbi:unnamed protein product [Cuscuta epithymum]|uniref:No apical meristem-associated C-terminal domain-containing protein n=1 Tax=Cuscuta epithymum TaxID=186058 RepID=A0AAV0CDA6_9ASTE|nr:unnamed protein product [Cuscuta epithymum]